MAKVRVRMNSRGAAELLHSAEVAAELRRRMDRAETAALSSAPVESGEYRDSLHVETDHAPSRVRVRLVADAPHALVVEARDGVLARSLDAAGGS